MPDDDLAKRMTTALTAKSATVRKGQHEESTPFTIKRIDAGKLLLPTGRLSITDAYNADSYPPLNRLVPPNSCPVELVIAQIPRNLPFGGERCAFALIKISDKKTTSWEPVTAIEPADPCFTDANPNTFVQEGATTLFSPEAAAVHFAHLHQQFDDQLKSIRQQSQHFGSHDWLNYRPGHDEPNVILVEAGMGDGHYQCFAGLDPASRVTTFVIDFNIADPS